MLVCQTPLRISFFGGGTDIPEYYTSSSRGGQVISAAIDKSTYVILNRLYRDQFVCNYTKKETANYIDDIQHEIDTTVWEYLRLRLKTGVEGRHSAE